METRKKWITTEATISTYCRHKDKKGECMATDAICNFENCRLIKKDIPRHSKEADFRFGKNSADIVSPAAWYVRIWRLLTNPALYLFTGKLRW